MEAWLHFSCFRRCQGTARFITERCQVRNLSCPCLGFYSLNVCFRVFLIQNTQVTDTWNKIAHSFHCTPIEGEAWGVAEAGVGVL